MKKIFPLLFVTIIACSDDNKRGTDQPPFDDYHLGLEFSHTSGTSTYELVNSFVSSAHLKDSHPVSAGEYFYFDALDSNGEMPASTLKVTTKESNVFAMDISGTLTRIGTKIPANYNGDPELWNSEVCYYRLLVECDPEKKEIISASYELWNEKFQIKEDLTASMWVTYDKEYEPIFRVTGFHQRPRPLASFNITVYLTE